jgi:hypothetical protein
MDINFFILIYWILMDVLILGKTFFSKKIINEK